MLCASFTAPCRSVISAAGYRLMPISKARSPRGGASVPPAAPATTSSRPVVSFTHCAKAPVLVYTPYLPGRAQPIPQLTTPTCTHSSPSRTISGPPLSPPQESFPP